MFYIFIFKDCRALCHGDCKDKLPLPCIPNVHTPKKKHKVIEHNYILCYMCKGI